MQKSLSGQNTTNYCVNLWNKCQIYPKILKFYPQPFYDLPFVAIYAPFSEILLRGTYFGHFAIMVTGKLLQKGFKTKENHQNLILEMMGPKVRN